MILTFTGSCGFYLAYFFLAIACNGCSLEGHFQFQSTGDGVGVVVRHSQDAEETKGDYFCGFLLGCNSSVLNNIMHIEIIPHLFNAKRYNLVYPYSVTINRMGKRGSMTKYNTRIKLVVLVDLLRNEMYFLQKYITCCAFFLHDTEAITTRMENVQRELDVKQQLMEETNALDCHPMNEAPGDDILTLPGALMIYQSMV